MHVLLPIEKGRKCGMFFLMRVISGVSIVAFLSILCAGIVSKNRSGMNSLGFSQYFSLVLSSWLLMKMTVSFAIPYPAMHVFSVATCGTIGDEE